MHMPEAWGYVQFVGPAEEGAPAAFADPSWPARLVASCVYYAQHKYKGLHGDFALSIDLLKDLLPTELMQTSEIRMAMVAGGGWVAMVGVGDEAVSVTADHLITIGEAQWAVGAGGNACGW